MAGKTTHLPKIGDGDSCPFRRLITRFLAYSRSTGLSERTLANYQDRLYKFRWWWVDHTRYGETVGAHPKFVTTEHAQEFAAYLRTELRHRWGTPVPRNCTKLSNASIASYGREIKVFFNWLEREGHIEATPFNRSVKFKARKTDTQTKCLTEEEVQKLFSTLSKSQKLTTYTGVRNLALIALLYDSGMRLGELLSLRHCDMDLKHNRCTVRGKTGMRPVVFSERCREFVSSYLRHPKYPKDYKPTDPLWLSDEKKPLALSSVETMCKRLSKESGVDFHPHLLRHTFATTMVNQGVHVSDLQHLLGHENITTTQIYIHKNVENLARVHRASSPLAGMKFPQIKRGRGRPRRILE